MNLKELQSMIKEELENYMGEEEVDVDVDMDAGDVDAEVEADFEEAGEEDVLRSIFDLLKAHFEGDEEAPEGMDDYEDVEGEEAPEAELEENSSTEASTQKTGMKPFGKGSAGANAGYGAVGGKGSTGYDASSQALQERFQKLANIIK